MKKKYTAAFLQFVYIPTDILCTSDTNAYIDIDNEKDANPIWDVL